MFLHPDPQFEVLRDFERNRSLNAARRFAQRQALQQRQQQDRARRLRRRAK